MDSRQISAKSIYAEINRLYQSAVVTKSKNIITSSLNKVSKFNIHSDTEIDYEKLVVEASKKLKVFDKSSSYCELEVFITEAVIAQSIQNMSPADRHKFFTQTIDIGEIVSTAKIENANYRGPLTTLAAIQIAGIGGFSTYLSATTALGFVTSSIGVTLPFSAYIGLTSTISVITGPVGWASVALWIGWKLTSPDWKKLIPVLIYLIAYKNAPSFT